MHESIFRGFLIYVLVATGACLCRAAGETADEVLGRMVSAYTSSDTISVQAYQREVWVPMRDASASQSGMGFNPPNNYRVLTLRERKPDDWYLSIWSFSKNSGRVTGAPVPMARPSGFFMAKIGGGLGKLGSFGGNHEKQSPQNSLTDDEFGQTLRSRLNGGSHGFVPLETLANSSASSSSVEKSPLDFRGEARLAGVETWRQHEVYRIEGSNNMGGQTIAWIGKESGLVERMVAMQGGGGTFRVMTETIYTTVIGAKLGMFDFDPHAPEAASDPLTDEQMGFGRVDDLRQYATNAAGVQPISPNWPTKPKVSSSDPVVATPPAVAEQQVLSAEQMEGIIFIDGDEGTATGFMTQIKGVDFVVTNQHVIGENKKITLKNLHGEEVPVLGIFGAVGSDIAILKIAKAQGTLKIAPDVLKSVKIGDKIVVVGNRLGGGVATQTSGQVLGVGPSRIEVNANFEPGNSGSPIFSASTNEVVGVATYAATRKISVEEGGSTSRDGQGSSAPAAKVEKRWFGYRLDGITKWEEIDLVKWHAQSDRIGKFRDLSEALVSVIQLDLKAAASNGKLAPIIADFEFRTSQMKNDRVGTFGAVKDMMRTIRTIAEAGINDFSSGDFYDYYRTCLYWEQSVPMQVDYRKAIVNVLKKYEANSSAYVSRMSSGGS